MDIVLSSADICGLYVRYAGDLYNSWRWDFLCLESWWNGSRASGRQRDTLEAPAGRGCGKAPLPHSAQRGRQRRGGSVNVEWEF